MYRRFTYSRYSERKMARSVALAVLAIVWIWTPTSLIANPESGQQGEEPAKVFRAGAYAIDITPLEFPVLVNGGVFVQVIAIALVVSIV